MSDITEMGVWGNHSPTMYPDLFHAEVGGERAAEVVDDRPGSRTTSSPTSANAAPAIIEARGASSAASAASAAIDHVRDWVAGSRRLGLDGHPL